MKAKEKKKSRGCRFGFVVVIVKAKLAFKAEIRVFEENAGVEEARAANTELVKGRPATGNSTIGEEIGNDGRNSFVAFNFPADVADDGGEFGTHAS